MSRSTKTGRTGYNRFLLVVAGLGGLLYGVDEVKVRDERQLRRLSDKMLGLIRDMDELTGTRREWLLGVWVSDARTWGASRAEKKLCERNARELLTIWTRYDNITDYANRQWNGLLGDFYFHRWEIWLKALHDSLKKTPGLTKLPHAPKFVIGEFRGRERQTGIFKPSRAATLSPFRKSFFKNTRPTLRAVHS